MNWRVFLLSIILAFLSTHCASGPVRDTNTPQGAFEDALDYQKEGRYEEAIQRLKKVKNRFPYSKYATEAELAIAEIHFEREAYIEAQHAYELFKELHPKFPRIDYVTYRLAMSYFNQVPDIIARDLTSARKAILYFDEIMQTYPQSEYAKESQEKKIEALRALAQKELYIAKFYFDREHCDSALGRYENVLQQYPNLGYEPRALYHLALCNYRLGNHEKAQQYHRFLTQKFSKSSEARKAQREFKKYGKI